MRFCYSSFTTSRVGGHPTRRRVVHAFAILTPPSFRCPRMCREIVSGTFLRDLLPILRQKGIIDSDRLALLSSTDNALLDSGIPNSELISLVIAWGLAASAAEFWRTHKGRDDLLNALWDHKQEEERQQAVKRYELEKAKEKAMREQIAMAAELQAAAAAAAGEGGETPEDGDGARPSSPGLELPDTPINPNMSVKEQVQRRRNSLVAVGSIFSGQEYDGDKFGTRGDYSDGMIYASRRRSMDGENRAKMEDDRKKQIEIAKAARRQAQRRSSVEAIIKREYCVLVCMRVNMLSTSMTSARWPAICISVRNSLLSVAHLRNQPMDQLLRAAVSKDSNDSEEGGALSEHAEEELLKLLEHEMELKTKARTEQLLAAGLTPVPSKQGSSSSLTSSASASSSQQQQQRNGSSKSLTSSANTPKVQSQQKQRGAESKAADDDDDDVYNDDDRELQLLAERSAAAGIAAGSSRPSSVQGSRRSGTGSGPGSGAGTPQRQASVGSGGFAPSSSSSQPPSRVASANRMLPPPHPHTHQQQQLQAAPRSGSNSVAVDENDEEERDTFDAGPEIRFTASGHLKGGSSQQLLADVDGAGSGSGASSSVPPFNTMPQPSPIQYQPPSQSADSSFALAPASSSGSGSGSAGNTGRSVNWGISVVQPPEPKSLAEAGPDGQVRIRNKSGELHRIGSERFYTGPQRPKKVGEERTGTASGSSTPNIVPNGDFIGDSSLTPGQRAAAKGQFHRNLVNFGVGNTQTQGGAFVARMALRTMVSGADAAAQDRAGESHTLQAIKSQIASNNASVRRMPMSLADLHRQASYHRMSQLLREDRNKDVELNCILDTHKTPSNQVFGLMRFVEEHADDIPGATGGLVGDIDIATALAHAGLHPEEMGFSRDSVSTVGASDGVMPLPAGATDDDYGLPMVQTPHGNWVDDNTPRVPWSGGNSRTGVVSSPINTSGNGRSNAGRPPIGTPNQQPSASSPVTSPSSPMRFGRAKPSAAANEPKLSKPMLERQLTKVDLYYRPVTETNKQVLVLDSASNSSFRNHSSLARGGATLVATPIHSPGHGGGEMQWHGGDHQQAASGTGGNGMGLSIRSPTASDGAAKGLLHEFTQQQQHQPQPQQPQQPQQAPPQVQQRSMIDTRPSTNAARSPANANQQQQQRLSQQRNPAWRDSGPADPRHFNSISRGGRRSSAGAAPDSHMLSSSSSSGHSAAEEHARRLASERSKRLLAEIRAIERQLLVDQTSSTGGGQSPDKQQHKHGRGSRSPRVLAGAGSVTIDMSGSASSSIISMSNGGRASSPLSVPRPVMPSTVGYVPMRSSRTGTDNLSGSPHRSQHANSGSANQNQNDNGGASGSASIGYDSIDAMDYNAQHQQLSQSQMQDTFARMSQSQSARRSNSPRNDTYANADAAAATGAGAMPRPTYFPESTYEPVTISVERDHEFDTVAKQLHRLRARELKQRNEMRLIKTYTSQPLV